MVVNFSIYKRQGKYPTCPMHSCISSLLVRNFACANDLTLRMATTWCHLCQLQQICQEWTSPCDLVAPYSSWVAKESDQHFQLSFSPHFWSSTLWSEAVCDTVGSSCLFSTGLIKKAGNTTPVSPIEACETRNLNFLWRTKTRLLRNTTTLY